LPDDFFDKWLKPITSGIEGVQLYGERPGGRPGAMKTLKKLVGDHFVGEANIVKAGGYRKAAEIILNSLPTNKRTRSGDIAELIASEYVDAKTSYRVPIKKLRWKSDRQMPMHGNDLIAVDTSGGAPVRLLKGECKSGAVFGAAPVRDAVATLDAYEGRPNPSTLAFITKRLYEEGRDSEAQIFQDLQSKRGIRQRDILHFVFALAGNNPSKYLANAPGPKKRGIKREAAAVVIIGHATFVAAVFESHGKKS
jgi:hypothetical protein